MFDVGFVELLVLGVLGLLVLGPERLPAVARTIGVWIGKARHMSRTLQRQIQTELALEEERLERKAESQKPHETKADDTDEEDSSVADEADAPDLRDHSEPDIEAEDEPDLRDHSEPVSEDSKADSSQPPTISKVPDPGHE